MSDDGGLSEVLEPCVLGGETVLLPTSLSRVADLGSILSFETWQSLTEEDRRRLELLLPSEAQCGQDADTLVQSLLAKDNFFFGTPLDRLQNLLETGVCHQSVIGYRQRFLEVQERVHLHSVRRYHEEFTAACARYTKTPMPSLSGPIEAASRGGVQSHVLRFSSATGSGSDTDSGGSDRANHASDEEEEQENFKYKRHKRKAQQQQQHRAAKKARKAAMPVPVAAGTPSAPKKSVKKESTQVHLQREEHLAELRKQVFPLFPMIKKVIQSCGEDNAASVEMIVEKVSSDPSQYFPPPWTPTQLVTLGLKYLSSPALIGPPIVRLDTSSIPNQWQWTQISPTDEQLQSLEQQFFYALTRCPTVNMEDPVDDLKAVISRRDKCEQTIPLSPADLERYHVLERERYANPDRPKTYDVGGYKSVVSPLKKINPGTRVREHYLLRAERPPFINLLCLVRDAASRLPGGVGTRPEVAQLLRNSQFIVDGVSIAQMNNVVSGALDRLHSEKEDPCVSYATDQRLWVYLHRNRKERDFQ